MLHMKLGSCIPLQEAATALESQADMRRFHPAKELLWPQKMTDNFSLLRRPMGLKFTRPKLELRMWNGRSVR